MSNQIDKYYLLKSLFFSGLLAGTWFVQTSLKTTPLLAMLAFSAFTLFSFFSKQLNMALPLFLVLLSGMLFINFMLLTDGVMGVLYPDKGWVEVDGEKQSVMDMSWIAGLIVSVVLTPITVWLYHYKSNRNIALEMICTLMFVFMTLAVFLIF